MKMQNIPMQNEGMESESCEIIEIGMEYFLLLWDARKSPIGSPMAIVKTML